MTTPDQHSARSTGDDRGLGQRLKDAVMGERDPDEGRVREGAAPEHDLRRDDPHRGDADAARRAPGAAYPDPGHDSGRDADRADADTRREDTGYDTARSEPGYETVGDTRDSTRGAVAGAGSGADERAGDTALVDDDRTDGGVAQRDTTTDRDAQLGRDSASVGGHDDGDREHLVPAQRAQEYSSRWDALKGDFVDEPRQALAKADQLVDELLDEIQELFRGQRRDLEQELDRDQASTEDLRLALRRYRSFFDRLLSF